MPPRSKIRALADKQGKPVEVVLRDAFKQHGTQSAVAAALGVSQSTISLWLLRLGLTQKTILIKADPENEKAAPSLTGNTRPEVLSQDTSPQL